MKKALSKDGSKTYEPFGRRSIKFSKGWVLRQLRRHDITDEDKLALLTGHGCKTVAELVKAVEDYPEDSFSCGEAE